ncbi:MAG: hypothetical protein LBK59_04150 [Bifidobacteriaceae bacterium]|nr:hypothetical protein [Bifidobacteriaceae bacterium]
MTAPGTLVADKVPRVNVANGDVPQGMVSVTWGPKKADSVSAALKVSQSGKVLVTLPRFKAGTYKIRARFTDTTGAAHDAISKAVRIKVAKKQPA